MNNQQFKYLANIAPSGSDNFFICYIFQRMDTARKDAVTAARNGNIRKFRDAFMEVGKEIVCEPSVGVPHKGYNRHTLSAHNYTKYQPLFATVSQSDALEFYSVTAEEYKEWMSEWTTFYFLAGKTLWPPTLYAMDFPNEEVAKQQAGEFPNFDGRKTNKDLWEEHFEQLYYSIDDDPNLSYTIEYIGTTAPVGHLIH